MSISKKHLNKILAFHSLTTQQWGSFNELQRKTLQSAQGAINVNDPAFAALNPKAQAEVPPQAEPYDGSKSSSTPEPEPQTAPEVPPEPSIDSLGANTIGKRRGPTGPREGASMGAKPLVRKLLGTQMEDGTWPSMSVEELCTATKKSEVNIRTILYDLRSPKYCGAGGIFNTASTKEGTVTKYHFVP